MAVSFSMPMGSDSVVSSFTSITQKTETVSTTNTDVSVFGMEVGYNKIKVQLVQFWILNLKFKATTGSFSNAAANHKADGASTQDLEIKMSYSR